MVIDLGNDERMIIGFGIHEKDFEKQEIEFIDRFLAKKLHGKKATSFDDELIAELKAEIKAREDEYSRICDEYATAEARPERYGYVYSYIVVSGDDLFVVLKFGHINRNHPISPDGWGLFQSKRIFHAELSDYE